MEKKLTKESAAGGREIPAPCATCEKYYNMHPKDPRDRGDNLDVSCNGCHTFVRVPRQAYFDCKKVSDICPNCNG